MVKYYGIECSFADYDVKDFQQGKVLLRYTQGNPFENSTISKKSKNLFKLNDINNYIRKDNFKGILILSTTEV